MKQSNLALRAEELEPDTPLEAEPQDCAEMSPAARRVAHSRRLGLEYRAIVIHDDGLRPFRVR